MKFSVGYRLCDPDEESFISIVERYKEHIKEVYFPWLGISSGRGVFGEQDGFIDWSAQNALLSDLKALKKLGVKLAKVKNLPGRLEISVDELPSLPGISVDESSAEETES